MDNNLINLCILPLTEKENIFGKGENACFKPEGFFFRVRGRHPMPVQRGKMYDKAYIWGKFSVNVVLHHFIFV